MLGSIAMVILAAVAVPPVGWVGSVLCVLAISVSLWMTRVAWRFTRQPDMTTVRTMLRVSLLQLPLTMLLILLAVLFN